MSFNAKDASPADIELINEMEARAQQDKIDAEQIDAYFAEELASLDDENQAFDEELARLAAIERLAALRSDEYRLATQQAEKAAKALEAAEAAKQLAAKQLAEKQKLVKPQRKPSKQSSKKKGSEKKKIPSPSSVLDDLELAILRSLEDEQVEGREASQKPFEEWINEFSEEHPARARLYDLFNGGGWTVVNPRGDGFCGLYVAAIDFQNNYSPNTDPMLVARVEEIDRDGLIELIIDGMKKYYEARNLHIELGIPIPSELGGGRGGENKIINVDDSDVTSYFELTEQLLVNNEEFIREKLRILGRLGNTPEALFVFLPYIYKRSYLILSYDAFRRKSPFLTTFMPCYADVRRDARGNAIYPYGEFTNSALMFNNGHYFLLNNPDSAIKAEVITNILENKFSDEPRRLWQQIFAAEGRRLRKRKVITKKVKTHKQKPRPHKLIRYKVGTKKMRTQKMRTQKALRRKHKPRTHTLKKQ
uniref:Uncharacterized protein n=1 Tax=viral metagenome TaxID=1070528 RepID=A0A6C0D593_9ZZZZ